MTNPTYNWVFLRGLARETAHWGTFLDEFQKAFPKDKIHALDLPGCGKYFSINSPLSLQKITEHVRKDFLKSGDKGAFTYVVALSLGAMVTIDWITRYPKELAGAVLINLSVGGISPFYRRLRIKALSSVLKIFLASRLEQRERKMLELVSNRPEIYDQVEKEWVGIQKKRPIKKRNGIYQLWAAFTFSPKADLKGKPVLLLSSEKDRLVDTRCSKDIASEWNLELRTHPESGHDLVLDAPGWALSEIQSWIKTKRASFI